MSSQFFKNRTMNIMYIKGDATSPIAPNNKVITHICNDIGGWGYDL